MRWIIRIMSVVAFANLGLSGIYAAEEGASSDELTTFHCELRSPAGDAIGLKVYPFETGGKPALLIGSRDDESWPGKEQHIFAPFEKAGTKEIEYSSGPRRIRIERDGPIRNMTVWSYSDGHVKQPLAFGFCGNAAIDSAADLVDADVDPFDTGRWLDGCFMTSFGEAPIRTRFLMDQDADENGRLEVSFFGGEVGPFAEKQTVHREVMGPGPKAEHPDVFMGVGRFSPDDGGNGPNGMDVMYVDRKTGRFSTLVAFDRLGSGSENPAFAICSGTIVGVDEEFGS
jgi:hypothetical protein